ncbi:GntR family transcriptional regulator [Cryobacterium sp. PH31-AA6]|uniref:GntR family transcriptional regulator n=1 Tax=Cryobacterium sp. PH31-AA6 TaxID=3046205 RepID=UPI0024BB1F33|nr:GntR family transcriptional regulator [Cryobacterium sp. PH31-AA6]MDJ0324632.1 GntR family transcriptional regulator [Cryobacterium sp. PH31-AA6]
MSKTSTRDGTARNRIADSIRASILAGEYPPDTRIRQEDVAERFGASRLPVREALRILESDGLVRLVANTGAWVNRLTLAECEEIYQTRERIEPLLLRYAMPHLDDAMINRLDELARAMEETTDVEEFLRLDREFHLASYAPSDTRILGDLVRRLWNSTQYYRRTYAMLLDDDRRRIMHDEHHMLTAALREGDALGAERVVESHIRRTRLQLARHPEVFDLPTSPHEQSE